MGNIWCVLNIAIYERKPTYGLSASPRSILHNPEEYPEPEEFRPERFLKHMSDGKYELDATVRDPRTLAFGFGRRCVPSV